jgi:uncharacterized protein (TIGR03067 family)
VAGKRADPLSNDGKKELAKLQGEWVFKQAGRNGKKVELGDATLVLEIKGAKWILTGQEKGEFIAIDPTTDPKCFDLKSVEESRKGQVDEGIFKIEGDTLTVCLHQGKERQRPTRFETSPEQPDTILAVFSRAKKK